MNTQHLIKLRAAHHKEFTAMQWCVNHTATPRTIYKTARLKPSAAEHLIEPMKNDGFVSIKSVRNVYNAFFKCDEDLYEVYWSLDHTPENFVGLFFARCFENFCY